MSRNSGGGMCILNRNSAMAQPVRPSSLHLALIQAKKIRSADTNASTRVHKHVLVQWYTLGISCTVYLYLPTTCTICVKTLMRFLRFLPRHISLPLFRLQGCVLSQVTFKNRTSKCSFFTIMLRL